VTINQLNEMMRACRPKRVGPLVNKVIHGDSDNWKSLFGHMQKDTATYLRRQKAENAEVRIIRWTIAKHLSAGFDNFEEDIVKLGFGTCDEITGKVHIPPEQPERIMNFDETWLNLSGSDTHCGGRPDAVIYDPRFPVVGLATSKSSLTSTLITGSTASGEVLPPHILS